VITVATGGSIVQLIIFLFKRRAELQALDRTSAAPLFEAQNALVDRLAAAEVKALGRVTALEEQLRVRDLEYTATLETGNRERARLTSELATLRTEVDISRRQITDLTGQLQGLYRSRRGMPDDDG
jgi:hypothetical protein